MDKPLQPPSMRRVVTVDRRAMPVTPAMPKNRYAGLTEEELHAVGVELRKRHVIEVQAEIWDWNDAWELIAREKRRNAKPLEGAELQAHIDRWMEARRDAGWI